MAPVDAQSSGNNSRSSFDERSCYKSKSTPRHSGLLNAAVAPNPTGGSGSVFAAMAIAFGTSRRVPRTTDLEYLRRDRLVENKLREIDRVIEVLRLSLNHKLNLVHARQS